MTGKIFKSIFISAIAVLLSAFAVTVGFSYETYRAEAEGELSRETAYVRAGIESYGYEYLSTVSDIDTRITVVDKFGRVTFDTQAEGVEALGDHSEREEIAEARESGVGVAVRQSETLSVRCIYYAVLLEDGAVLRLSHENYSVFDLILDVLLPTLILFCAVSVFVYFIARRLSKSIVRPINEMDMEHPESLEIYDELKPVVKKISTLNYRITRQMNELKMRELEFTSITSNMSEGMIVVNSRTMILTANESAMRILGIKDSLGPQSVLAYNTTEDFSSAVRCALSGKNGYGEIRLGDKHYSIIATPVLKDGDTEGAVIVIIDDTEKEERESLRREFTSNVSHELKTPLTSISGFAELIKCGMAEGDEAKHFAANIHKEAKRLITLVGDIIRLTQLDGGEIPYDGEIDILAVAEEVAERLANIAETAGVTLSVSGSRECVLGTADILEEMIYNLCDNAIKYNKRGGFVRVSIVRERGEVHLSVSDNGIGIPQDKQDRVFERFYRVDKSHSRDIGGTGLGLSIVKHAAAYHKAKIELESELSVGTTVTVKFSAKK